MIVLLLVCCRNGSPTLLVSAQFVLERYKLLPMLLCKRNRTVLRTWYIVSLENIIESKRWLQTDAKQTIAFVERLCQREKFIKILHETEPSIWWHIMDGTPKVVFRQDFIRYTARYLDRSWSKLGPTTPILDSWPRFKGYSSSCNFKMDCII